MSQPSCGLHPREVRNHKGISLNQLDQGATADKCGVT